VAHGVQQVQNLNFDMEQVDSPREVDQALEGPEWQPADVEFPVHDVAPLEKVMVSMSDIDGQWRKYF
jgi:hypothetical protein